MLADYVDEKGIHLKNKQIVAYCVEKLSFFWGDKAVSTIRESECRAYIDFRNAQFKSYLLKKGLPLRDIKPSSIARELSVLSAAITNDHKAGRLVYSVPVWTPKFENKKDRWLSRKEVADLLRASRKKRFAYSYLPIFILMGIYTGARTKSILGLKWDKVDLEARLIDFRSGAGNKKGALIPIPAKLYTFLSRIRQSPTGFVLVRQGKKKDRRIFSIKKTFIEACNESNLGGVTPHTLRHTSASWMTQRGVSFAKIARYLGHSDSRVTERIYSHHAPDYLQDVADSFRRSLPPILPQNNPHRKDEEEKTERI